MITIFLMVVVSGAVLLIDRYRYFLSDPAKAFFWFIFVVQLIVLIASIIEGKPLIFAPE